jgi:hypothetical protein
VLAVVLALTVVNFAPQYIMNFVSSWLPVFDKTITPLTVVQSHIGDHYLQACQAILNKTRSNAKVLLLYEQRGLYIPRDYVVATPYFQEKLFTPLEKSQAGDDFLATLRAEQITHVLVAYDISDPDRMEKYMREAMVFLAPIYAKGGFIERGKLTTVWSWPERDPEYGLDYALYEVH